MAELGNEADARQMVQNVLQAIKDKIRQLESGSCSGALLAVMSVQLLGGAEWYVRKTAARSGR